VGSTGRYDGRHATLGTYAAVTRQAQSEQFCELKKREFCELGRICSYCETGAVSSYPESSFLGSSLSGTLVRAVGSYHLDTGTNGLERAQTGTAVPSTRPLVPVSFPLVPVSKWYEPARRTNASQATRLLDTACVAS
jgi:hypothetical protein